MTLELRAAVDEATPLGGAGEAADAAAVVSFLCSDPAARVTGQTLRSDGGFALIGGVRRSAREPD